MKIALVRHGRPDVDFSNGSAHHLDWVEAYDLAGIDPELPPPARVREIAAASAYLGVLPPISAHRNSALRPR